MATSMRPGIFTSYTVSTLRSSYKGRAIGIVGSSNLIAPGIDFTPEIKHPTSTHDSQTLYGGSSFITGLIDTVLNNLQCDIYATSVEENNLEHYKAAFELLLAQEDIYCIVSDNTQLEFALYAKSRLPFSNGPKLYITGILPDSDANTFARAINCERIAIAYPNINKTFNSANVAPALLASLISLNPTSTLFLSGRPVLGNYRFYEFPTEEEKNACITDGICVFESVGDEIQLIRAVSSKSRNDDNYPNSTYRDLAVITGLDEITVSISSLLKRCIQGAAGIISLEAINSIVLGELVSLKDKGIISNFMLPSVVYHEDDLTTCIITLCITLRRSVNQIYLNLNIAV